MQADDLLLWNAATLLRPDILPWLLALPLLAVASAVLLLQWVAHRRLVYELRQLSKVKRHSIEYDLVLRAMRLCVWHLDVSSRVLSYESDYRDFGDSLVPPAGSKCDDLFAHMPPAHAESVGNSLEALISGRSGSFREQYQILLPDGGSYWAESFASVDRRSHDGSPLTIVGASMRIDHQKEIENALMDALYHAEESDRLKSAFLTNISHEIRTPLNAIVGFSDVLADAQSEEERQELIALIKKNNATLLRLFDDTVRMSKLEARGGEAARPERFSLKGLFEEIIASYRTDDGEESGVAMLIDAHSDDDHLWLITDRNKLMEILNQYVNNALKFTASGSVTLGHTDAGDTVRVWVRDTGRGIPADKCNEHLFDRFFKIDDFVEGTGLGLSICRSLALSMNGSVGVESEEGKGSCFWVDIPAV